ncbi:MAG: Rep catalytic domain protein [Cressdnaviricota sp.]|nr:MAG: Rep catalytic domain protein [Cressdnaviricota sp.]
MSRLEAKKYLLTYARCTLSKEEILSHLQSLTTVETYTVSRENHQDGTPHVHACIILQSSPRTRNMRYFDIDGLHPNIATLKTMSDFERASKYCQKDGDFITNVKEHLSKRAQLFKDLLEEGLTPSFVKTHPEIMALNYDQLRKWLSFVRPELQLPAYLHLPKRRHLWLTGPSNSGKTYFLSAYISMHHWPEEIPRNNDFYGMGPSTDLLFSDEYKGHLSVQELNRLCDGRCKLNTKGGSTFISYPTVVIVSNFAIEECYSKVGQDLLVTLHNRFNQYVFPLNRPKFPTREL